MVDMTLTVWDVAAVSVGSALTTLVLMFIWRVFAAAAEYRRAKRVRENVLMSIHESMRVSQEFNGIIKNIEFGDD